MSDNEEKVQKETERKPTEFKFRGKWWDLDNILGEDHIFQSEDGDFKIVTRAGVGTLIDHFDHIDITFGPIQTTPACGEEVVCVEVCAEDLWEPTEEEIADGWACSNRPGRSFGEASSANCRGIAAKYPISMATKRGTARAVFDLLGIRNTFSEDEAQEFKEDIKNQKAARSGGRKSSSKAVKSTENIKEVLAEITKLVEELRMTEEDKLNAYREALGDMELTKKQIIERATDKTKITVRDRLRARAENGG